MTKQLTPQERRVAAFIANKPAGATKREILALLDAHPMHRKPNLGYRKEGLVCHQSAALYVRMIRNKLGKDTIDTLLSGGETTYLPKQKLVTAFSTTLDRSIP